MIEEVLALPRNNPVFSFDRYHEVESWLREQWAGLFQELLRRMTSQERLTSLSNQVEQLSESNKTLKRYLESLMTQVSPNESKTLIDQESKRLEELMRYKNLEQNPFVKYVTKEGMSLVDVSEALTEAKSINGLFKIVAKKLPDEEFNLNRVLAQRGEGPRLDIEEAREAIGLPPLVWGISKKEAKKRAQGKGRGS